MTPTGACPAEESTRMWLAPVRPPHMTTMKRRNGAPGEVAVEQILPVKPDLTSHTKGRHAGQQHGQLREAARALPRRTLELDAVDGHLPGDRQPDPSRHAEPVAAVDARQAPALEFAVQDVAVLRTAEVPTLTFGPTGPVALRQVRGHVTLGSSRVALRSNATTVIVGAGGTPDRTIPSRMRLALAVVASAPRLHRASFRERRRPPPAAHPRRAGPPGALSGVRVRRGGRGARRSPSAERPSRGSRRGSR
jgi:hypothetical protein